MSRKKSDQQGKMWLREDISKFFSKNSALFFGRTYSDLQIASHIDGLQFKAGRTVFKFSLDEKFEGKDEHGRNVTFSQDVVRYKYKDLNTGKDKIVIHPITEASLPQILVSMKGIIEDSRKKGTYKGFKVKQNRAVEVERDERFRNVAATKNKESKWQEICASSIFSPFQERGQAVTFNYSDLLFCSFNPAEKTVFLTGKYYQGNRLLDVKMKVDFKDAKSIENLQKCVSILNSQTSQPAISNPKTVVSTSFKSPKALRLMPERSATVTTGG